MQVGFVLFITIYYSYRPDCLKCFSFVIGLVLGLDLLTMIRLFASWVCSYRQTMSELLTLFV